MTFGAAGFARADQPMANPEPSIPLRATVNGKYLTGLNELAKKEIAGKSSTAAEQSHLGGDLEEAAIRYKPGSKIPFLVNRQRPDGSWQDITQDQRLHVTVTFDLLVFKSTGSLAPNPNPKADLPTIASLGLGTILTVYTYFIPDEKDSSTFGYNQFYLKVAEQ